MYKQDGRIFKMDFPEWQMRWGMVVDIGDVCSRHRVLEVVMEYDDRVAEVALTVSEWS